MAARCRDRGVDDGGHKTADLVPFVIAQSMKVWYMELFDKMELHTGVTIAEFDATAHKVTSMREREAMIR